MAKKKKQSAAEKLPVDPEVIDEHTENATIDCYNDSEVASGWQGYLSDEVELPFETVIFGQTVTVVDFDLDNNDSVVAICERADEQLGVSLIDLPLPSPPPRGWEIIVAYRRYYHH